MIPIPPEFLQWLKDRIKPLTKQDNKSLEPIDIDSNSILKDIQGNRNNTLLALGGIFRQEMNIKTTNFALNVINKKLFENPLPNSEVQHIIESISNYVGIDDTGLSNEIIGYLKETDTASKTEIEAAIFGGKTTSENKKRLDRTLMTLIHEDKITKKNSREYRILHNMEWDDKILNVGTPLNFKVPYFEDYAHFNYGDLVLVGAVQKFGKTSLAMNFVQRIIVEGVKPYYIYSESGGRYAKTAWILGMKDGDFYKCRCSNPNDIILKPNSVVIYDWIRPRDFAKTDELYEGIVDKLDKTNSFMIGFVQLREGSELNKNKNEWFAKDLIRQHVSMSAKYLYKDKEGIETYFDIDDLRDAKTFQKRCQIPCRYNKQTREVKMIEEIERENQVKNFNGATLQNAALNTEPSQNDGSFCIKCGPTTCTCDKPLTPDEIKFNQESIDPADR
jgi:hypothetical protein